MPTRSQSIVSMLLATWPCIRRKPLTFARHTNPINNQLSSNFKEMDTRRLHLMLPTLAHRMQDTRLTTGRMAILMHRLPTRLTLSSIMATRRMGMHHMAIIHTRIPRCRRNQDAMAICSVCLSPHLQAPSWSFWQVSSASCFSCLLQPYQLHRTWGHLSVLVQ